MGTGSAIPQCPQPMGPHEGGSGHGAEGPVWQAGAAHSSIPAAVRVTAAAGAPNPALPQTTAVPKGDTEAKPRHRLCRPGLHQRGLTETRLELHQVSALSQLQARMSFTVPDSLLQMRALNTRRGITTRDQGQQQRRSPFLEPVPIVPSPFPSWPLFTLEGFSGLGVCPQEPFMLPLWLQLGETPLIPKLLLDYTPALGRGEFPPPVL